MTKYYRVMLGQGSMYAQQAIDGDFVGVGFDINVDLTHELRLGPAHSRPLPLTPASHGLLAGVEDVHRPLPVVVLVAGLAHGPAIRGVGVDGGSCSVKVLTMQVWVRHLRQFGQHVLDGHAVREVASDEDLIVRIPEVPVRYAVTHPDLSPADIHDFPREGTTRPKPVLFPLQCQGISRDPGDLHGSQEDGVRQAVGMDRLGEDEVRRSPV
jgi:hypothetical protein